MARELDAVMQSGGYELPHSVMAAIRRLLGPLADTETPAEKP